VEKERGLVELNWQGCQAGEKLGLQEGLHEGQARLQGGQQSQRRQGRE
jgi:flagellar biosynthesis/type III secretory pathway protein FliH